MPVNLNFLLASEKLNSLGDELLVQVLHSCMICNQILDK